MLNLLTMGKLLAIVLVLTSQFCLAQSDSAMAEISKFQEELNVEYRNPKTSPLKGKAQKRFKKHEFFQVDLQYRVEATLTVTDAASFFPMMTSSQVPKEYRVYGMLQFMLKGKSFEVPVYQSKMLMAMEMTDSWIPRHCSITLHTQLL